MSKKTLIYTRVSTTEQTEKFGLDTQLRDCRAYAASHDMQIVAELSDDISGTVPIDERPQGKLIYQYVDNGEVDAVLMPTIDRTSRDERAIDYQIFKYRLYDNEVELHYADSGIEHTGTMEGDLIGYIKSKMAGEERKKILKRTMEGKKSKALKNKLVMTGTPPYGYYREGKRETAKMFINEPDAQVVRQIYIWYVRGNGDGKPYSLRQIANHLNTSNRPTPHYSENCVNLWLPATIRGILSNEIYTGITYYGKTKGVKVKGKKNKRRVMTTQEEWIKIEVPELSIIDRELYELAQERKERNKELSKRNRKRDYLLSSYFRCHACGSKLAGTFNGSKKYRYYSYRCVSYWARPGREKCPGINRLVSMKLADETVWEWVKGLLIDEENLEIGLERMIEMRKNDNGQKRLQLERLENSIDLENRKASRLLKAFENEEDDNLVAELKSSYKNMNKQIEILKHDRELLIAEMEEIEIDPEKLELVRQRAAQIRQKLNNPTMQQKRNIFETIRLECVFRQDDAGRWIDAKCDLLPEGGLIALSPSSMFVLHTCYNCDIVTGIHKYR